MRRSVKLDLPTVRDLTRVFRMRPSDDARDIDLMVASDRAPAEVVITDTKTAAQLQEELNTLERDITQRTKSAMVSVKKGGPVLAGGLLLTLMVEWLTGSTLDSPEVLIRRWDFSCSR